MFRSILLTQSRVIPTKGLILNNRITPIVTRMWIHSGTINYKNGDSTIKSPMGTTNLSDLGTQKHQQRRAFQSDPPMNKGTNGSNSQYAKILALLAFGGALYFVFPYKISLTKKKDSKLEEQTEQHEIETKLADPANEDESAESSEEAVNEEVKRELETLDEVNTGKLAETEEEVNKEGAYNPETGEINWDCPCLGGMADGPCGEEFKEAFACFVYSEAEPKGIDCVEKFQTMQTCFRKYPEHYAEQLKDEEEVNAETIRENEQEGDMIAPKDDREDVSVESSFSQGNDKGLTQRGKEDKPSTTPDILDEEPVIIGDLSNKQKSPSDADGNEITETMEEIELTENS